MRITSVCCKTVLLAVIGSLLRIHARSGPGTGAITGTVYDPAGAVVQHAQVALKSESTGAIRTGSSNGIGVFTFALLPPGSYSASVKSAGFAERTTQGINVVVAETSVVDFHLLVESAGASITVAPDVELAQTEIIHAWTSSRPPDD